MQTDSIELGFLSIFALITFFIFLIINNYSSKISNGIFLDDDFNKPQSFHNEAITRSGGIASFICLIFFFGIYYLLYSELLIEYFLVCSSLFVIGYFDDIKIRISPNKRLFLMVITLFILINFIPIRINNIDFIFLSYLMESKIFSVIFVLICFLFVINGANFIDGFNGLLTINLIIINSILLYINLNNDHLKISYFITSQLIILVTFLLFNFPKAKMFLGDSGSYLFGSLISLNSIITNNLNPQISSFFFCILLFYLFFEVFFSFVRKTYQNKSPVLPDREHLHMLSFISISKFYGSEKGNYVNSIVINLVYGFFILPSIFFADNSLICKIWFFSLILIYFLIYQRLYRLTKN
ncbi:MAG: hypothetical protein CMJ01_00310 [Pelagibacteraceae bacterium]|nr:hypothetical protein [Pelagibacteraceae bacterium]|tara:strand:- start:9922 stop:10983 length:1062 start_codon:yes stop_codon:yes gene_type:complete